MGVEDARLLMGGESSSSAQQATDTLAGYAETFLKLLAKNTWRTRSLERYYVKVAFKYGLTVERIAELSTIPGGRVQVLLTERDGQ